MEHQHTWNSTTILLYAGDPFSQLIRQPLIPALLVSLCCYNDDQKDPRRSYSPHQCSLSTREARKGTPGRNLVAGTEVDTMENSYYWLVPWFAQLPPYYTPGTPAWGWNSLTGLALSYQLALKWNSPTNIPLGQSDGGNFFSSQGSYFQEGQVNKPKYGTFTPAEEFNIRDLKLCFAYSTKSEHKRLNNI